MDIGSPTRARTWDLRINSPSLYQLSYRGVVDLLDVFLRGRPAIQEAFRDFMILPVFTFCRNPPKRLSKAPRACAHMVFRITSTHAVLRRVRLRSVTGPIT
jgi:hypothetical protein